MTTANAANPKNRRAFPRRISKRKVAVGCRKGALDLGPNLAVALLDISESGARLIIKVPMDKGQEVTLTLEGQGHQRPIKIPGTIVWCEPTLDNSHIIGVRLDKRLPYAEIQKLT